MQITDVRKRSDLDLAQRGNDTQSKTLSIFAVVVGAVAYNAGLAILSAFGLPISAAVVALVEITFLVLGFLIALHSGLKEDDLWPMFMLYMGALISLIVSLYASQIYLDPARNFAILSIFTMLGARSDQNSTKKIFLMCSSLVFIGLILEISSLDLYTRIFQPGAYLSATRGLADSEYANGLSIGTIAFEGRFSFGIFGGPRTSSIFLEQVSINCFSIVIALYCMTMWPALTRLEKVIHSSVVLLIILTNNARLGTMLLVVFTLGYFVFPRLPSILKSFLPAFLLIGLFILFLMIDTSFGDDFRGRLSVTYRLLTELTMPDFLLGNPQLARQSGDSGYSYLVCSSTLFGAIIFWAYTSVVVPAFSPAQRRCGLGIMIYLSVWLLVAGTGSFSMKTAPLLWLLAGHLRSPRSRSYQ